MTNGNQLTREDQAMLVEYQECQSHTNSLGNQSWLSTSIILTINIVLIGQVVFNLVLTSNPNNGFVKLILVLVIAIVMVYILGIFWKWFKRTDFLAWLNNQRMREIENHFQWMIYKNWRVRGLDLFYDRKKRQQWYGLEKAQRRKLTRLSLLYPQKKLCKNEQPLETHYISNTRNGCLKFHFVYPILMIVWGIIIVLEILIYFCEPARIFLVN